MSTTKQPELFNLEAEEALVGSVIINPGIFPNLSVLPEHFKIHRLRYIWEAIIRLYSSQTPIDYITVSDELNRVGKLQDVGGNSYLAQIVNVVPSSLNAEGYAKTIIDLSKRRTWNLLATKIAKIAIDLESDMEKSAGDVIDGLLQAAAIEGGASHIKKYMEKVLEETLARRADPQDIWGIPTGFIDFDRITGGLQQSEILFISGEPGMGKSIMAAQMGKQMAQAGHPGVIYSLEMPASQVIRRWLSADSEVTTRNIKSGRVSDREMPKILKQIEEYEQYPLYISDWPMMTTAGVRADLSRMKAQYGVEWFVLDYAYLLRDGEGLSENDRTGLISSRLKSICRSLNMAGIVIHSLNKMGMNARIPTGDNLRGSGQMFYDTDLILFLIKSEIANTVVCVFGKGRELEQPDQSFELRRIPMLPKLGNAAKIDTRLLEFAP